MKNSGWKAAGRLAWRETRATPGKFLFAIVAVACGVGALTGVRGFSHAFDALLNREARTFMAADMMLRVFQPLTAEQEKLLAELKRQSVDSTRITETLSMMSSENSPDPVLVSVKAVDPSVYPYYGRVALDPDRPLREALADGAVLVSDDLMVRLEIVPGSRVRLGAAEFAVAGVVRMEPDRLTGSLNVGPRVMITREGLERAQLIQPGSTASHRFLFKLGTGSPPVEEVRRRIREAFPRGLLTDYRAADPRIERALEQATRFLSLVSLISLIVGAIGVAMAIHSHLQQKLDHIAILKCLGARSSQVIRIYTLQTLAMGLAGGALGVAAGFGVQAAFPALLRKYFAVAPPFVLDWGSAAQGMAAAVLITLLFTLPPLLSIREIRPAVLLRREMVEAAPHWRTRWSRSKSAAICGALMLAGLAGVAHWLTDSWLVGAFFAGGLAISLLLLTTFAWVLLRSLRRAMRAARYQLPGAVRHGVANLYRPGNHPEWVLVALGLGVMFTLTVYLVQRSLLSDILQSAPPDMPNVYLINITSRERDGVLQMLRSRRGIRGEVEITPVLRGRLLTVDGKAPARAASSPDGGPERGERPRGRPGARTASVTWMEAQPHSYRILEGRWWGPQESGAVMAVSRREAQQFGIRLGSILEWDLVGRRVRARVAAIFEPRRVEIRGRAEYVFAAGLLRGLPALYFSAVRMDPAEVRRLQRDVFRAYPTITVINAADVLAIVQDVIDQVAIVTRFIAGFSILAGIIILAASVAGTRYRRMREVAVLKTLGAKRGRLVATFSTEFAILGLAAGLLGTLLSVAFSRMLMARLFNAPFEAHWLPAAITMLGAAVLAVAAGWLASARILALKPLEILRQE